MTKIQHEPYKSICCHYFLYFIINRYRWSWGITSTVWIREIKTALPWPDEMMFLFMLVGITSSTTFVLSFIAFSQRRLDDAFFITGNIPLQFRSGQRGKTESTGLRPIWMGNLFRMAGSHTVLAALQMMWCHSYRCLKNAQEKWIHAYAKRCHETKVQCSHINTGNINSKKPETEFARTLKDEISKWKQHWTYSYRIPGAKKTSNWRLPSSCIFKISYRFTAVQPFFGNVKSAAGRVGSKANHTVCR